jgi:hypothetical protein
MPHFILHAPRMPLGSFFQLPRDILLEIPDDELSHAASFHC